MWRAELLSSSAGKTNICTTRDVLVQMLVLLANKDNSFGGEGWELESVSVQDDARAADVVFGICGCEVCVSPTTAPEASSTTSSGPTSPAPTAPKSSLSHVNSLK